MKEGTNQKKKKKRSEKDAKTRKKKIYLAKKSCKLCRPSVLVKESKTLDKTSK